jgi:MinD superfamily P-loop ATPase
VEVVGKIPFNPVVMEAMVNGKAIIEYSPESDVAKEVAVMWRRLCSELSLEVTC